MEMHLDSLGHQWLPMHCNSQTTKLAWMQKTYNSQRDILAHLQLVECRSKSHERLMPLNASSCSRKYDADKLMFGKHMEAWGLREMEEPSNNNNDDG